VLAATRGHARLFRWLLDRGAALPPGAPSFFEAITHDQVGVVTLCLEAGLTLDQTDSATGRLPLTVAVGAGAARVVTLLLQRGAAVDAAAPGDGGTAVHAVGRMPAQAYASGVATAIMISLFEAGAKVDAVDAQGRTLLHEACGNAALPAGMLEVLLSLDIPLDARDMWGTTALWVAASGSRLDLVTVLLARGADPNVVTTADSPLARRGTSVYEAARERGELKLLSTLRDAGATTVAADSAAPGPLDPFGIGSVVTHARFGTGEVVATEGAGADRKLTIAFAGDTRVLHAKFVTPS
jgi:ankyrin repeat protein